MLAPSSGEKSVRRELVAPDFWKIRQAIWLNCLSSRRNEGSGSGVLVRSPMKGRLVDEFVLQIHPIVLGKGHRLFEPGLPKTDFTLAASTSTKSGIIVAAYQLRH
ncbi:hypothetical protein FJ546_03130 [Mesorhizobium sp. B2-4-19]|uniref:dihydrofolate reductase family protein n=1 Tax=Mesorhizobium sp. B2-4-19 TaxID=2589930 RepID=UPI001125BEF2|nr:dihydrofolate reductase family protein [Mesorhizobium sp. B2-4-19]TPK69600.1 hypothetical protein FJ546_03130 [Mesorhizobium sp. B2-4-19]